MTAVSLGHSTKVRAVKQPLALLWPREERARVSTQMQHLSCWSLSWVPSFEGMTFLGGIGESNATLNSCDAAAPLSLEICKFSRPRRWSGATLPVFCGQMLRREHL